ncbi:MAG: sulfite exporter TauE/SafE family protein [Gammaproteobacteria bacterium]|nr:sulfite exporter TauE/SafE family protein [Gammaproteobacteria bacterium]NIR96810.1 sulfite exporter TauE/SafE family protein [Gammaproteobacteria bacterium]NIT62510.1 sulfite exporter TauE/SafE family protein [Gammaproteobacteria bacterium]NIV19450.1 TSUP family transporter [Gammaproteobacteria bacterium]NIX10533.1 TSUP family transporter [Gammaproteobacteria bacterium]
MASLAKRVPELTLLIALTILAYAVMGLFSQVEGSEVLSPTAAWGVIVGSFLISTLVAIVAVLGGVGGGVLFTPIMLGFTSVDTLLVRSTGLVVAMFSGLVSSGPFMRKGLADIRIVFYCGIPIIIGAMAGAKAAISLAETMGDTGDAVVRLLLGVVLVFIALMFMLGGSKTEYPVPKRVDGLSELLHLKASYYEESLGKVVHYHAVRPALGFVLFLVVGFTGGFFGLGGGWAVVPVLNLVMSVPLKISAASSGVLLAMGNAAAIWPYIVKGALIAVFAAPWMIGQVIGGILGAHILARVKAAFVRNILIVLLVLTSIKLLARGIEGLTGIDIPLL